MESIPPHPTPILVVDDDIGLLLSIEAAIISAGMPAPALLSDPRRTLDLIAAHGFQVVLLDLIMTHLHGMDLLNLIQQRREKVECIIITAVDEVETAVLAIRSGAYDYLVKPVDRNKLMIALHRALEHHHLIHGLRPMSQQPEFSQLRRPEAFAEMVARDPSMASVFHQAELAASTDYSLILSGETGTGKGVLARIIHDLGPRKNGPFIAVNITASNRSLFEDDFFGHVRGAFTGADAPKTGFVESAAGGTLFLDEIAETEPSLQAKLLKVIEEKQVQPLGAERTRRVDVRVISATNRPLSESMDQGRFRRDLFYRLNTIHIHIPPLRQRPMDILPLAQHFLARHASRNSKQIREISSELKQALMRHPFPGNVRELENLIAAGALAERDSVLTIASLPELRGSCPPPPAPEAALATMKKMEKRHILSVLDATGGNRTHAAAILGIGIRTLRRRLARYDADR